MDRERARERGRIADRDRKELSLRDGRRKEKIKDGIFK